tara:strand:- start:489 stop:668 length:180 start_codon:yes stop_codon:yes gene_type:complete
MTSSFHAEFLDDNTLEIEWDVTDPELEFFTNMTDEEREKFVIEALERMIEQEENEAQDI